MASVLPTHHQKTSLSPFVLASFFGRGHFTPFPYLQISVREHFQLPWNPHLGHSHGGHILAEIKEAKGMTYFLFISCTEEWEDISYCNLSSQSRLIWLVVKVGLQIQSHLSFFMWVSLSMWITVQWEEGGMFLLPQSPRLARQLLGEAHQGERDERRKVGVAVFMCFSVSY